MRANRAFLPQQALDAWLSDGRIQLSGEIMTTPEDGRCFELHTAVHFVREVGGNGDTLGLIGKVKDLEQLRELGGEHYADSVIVGDEAYEVIEGFVGIPLASAPRQLAAENSLDAAIQDAATQPRANIPLSATHPGATHPGATHPSATHPGDITGPAEDAQATEGVDDDELTGVYQTPRDSRPSEGGFREPVVTNSDIDELSRIFLGR